MLFPLFLKSKKDIFLSYIIFLIIVLDSTLSVKKIRQKFLYGQGCLVLVPTGGIGVLGFLKPAKIIAAVLRSIISGIS